MPSFAMIQITNAYVGWGVCVSPKVTGSTPS